MGLQNNTGIKLTPKTSWTLGIGSTTSSVRKRMDCTAAPPHENILVLDSVLYFKGGTSRQDDVSNAEMCLAEWRAWLSTERPWGAAVCIPWSRCCLRLRDRASLPWSHTKLLLTLAQLIQQPFYDNYECITKHDERGDWSQHISQEKIILSRGKEKSD